MDVRFAPGCFGSSTQFAHDEVCGACPFAKECEPRHIEALNAMREYFGIKPKKSSAASKSKSEEGLPARAMKYLERAGKTLQQISDEILAARNPFAPSKKDFLFVVTEMLRISSKKGFIQEAAMIDRLAVFQDISQTTARFYVRTALQILDAAGVTQHSASGISLKRG